MSKIPVFVGLDYHQSSVQVCVLDRDGTVLGNRSCANQREAIQKQAERYGKIMGVAIESCSGAADLAEELIGHAGWPVHLAHPGYVNRMKQNPDKTDYTDARMLADLERVGYLPRVWLAPEKIRELRLLVRFRQQLVNQRRAVKLRITAVLREQRAGYTPYHRWTLVWLDWLEHASGLSDQGRWVIGRHLTRLKRIKQEITEVEKQLTEFTRDDPLIARLRSFPGIGPATAWIIRAEIGRFDRFASGKQLSRFCGLSPRNASSGERQADAGLIKAANRQLRATLIEAAHRLARYDERWRKMANQMRKRGKPGSVVAAAVANRWMRWLFHQLVHEEKAA